MSEGGMERGMERGEGWKGGRLNEPLITKISANTSHCSQ